MFRISGARQFWRMRHPVLLNLRSLAGVLGNLSVIYAFVHIPLAEVYALVFLAPLFVTILSMFVLKERVGSITTACSARCCPRVKPNASPRMA